VAASGVLRAQEAPWVLQLQEAPVAPVAPVEPVEPTCKKTVPKQVMSGGQVKTVQVEVKSCTPEWARYESEWARYESERARYESERARYESERARYEAAERARYEATERARQRWAALKAEHTAALEEGEVPAGTYAIGCTRGQGRECNPNEKGTTVTLTRSVLVMRREVTQGLYAAVMGSNPSGFQNCGLDCPVNQVSWFDAVNFANEVSKLAGLEQCYVISGARVTWPRGLSCKGYRLPTEAEWEVAARGGEDTRYAGGSDAEAVAWIDANSGGKPHAVGSKRANGYGLYDMSGNVSEWVWDWIDFTTPPAGADPLGPATGAGRVLRGGSWGESEFGVRVALRDGCHPERRFNNGLRLSRTAP
jgi:formylglycine-generating enzyme required for sulfatase activity